jgi:arabinose-5-phosphate isomerase
MMEIAHKRGTVAVVDEERRIVGVVTAGDLTRFADDNDDFLQHSVSEAMNRSPKTVTADMLAAEALFIMERHGIMALPVRDAADRLSGMVHLHDLMRARVV